MPRFRATVTWEYDVDAENYLEDFVSASVDRITDEERELLREHHEVIKELLEVNDYSVSLDVIEE